MLGASNSERHDDLNRRLAKGYKVPKRDINRGRMRLADSPRRGETAPWNRYPHDKMVELIPTLRRKDWYEVLHVECSEDGGNNLIFLGGLPNHRILITGTDSSEAAIRTVRLNVADAEVFGGTFHAGKFMELELHQHFDAVIVKVDRETAEGDAYLEKAIGHLVDGGVLILTHHDPSMTAKLIRTGWRVHAEERAPNGGVRLVAQKPEAKKRE